MAWDSSEAHSAIYDAERTAELFCTIVNLWDTKNRISNIAIFDKLFLMNTGTF